jgi:peroxiredoxin
LKSLFIFTLLVSQITLAGTDIRIKYPFPNFTLRKLSQKTQISLKQYRGKIVVIDFWASWCEPCRQEFPVLNTLYKKYYKKGVQVMGINVDTQETDATKFLKDNPVAFMLLHDDGNKLMEEFNLETMPRSFIVDRKGIVRFMHNGYNSDYDPYIFERELKTLL